MGDGTSKRLFKDGLCLPSGSMLTDEDIKHVAEAIENVAADFMLST